MASKEDKKYSFKHIDKVYSCKTNHPINCDLRNNTLIYFSKGDAIITIENFKYKLLEGDTVLIPLGTFMSITIEPTKKFECFIIKFANSFIDEEVRNIYSNKKYLVNDIRLFQYFNNFEKFNSYGDEFTSSTLIKCELTKLILLMPTATSDQNKINSDSFLEKIMKYINKNINLNLSAENIALALKISKSRLTIQFKKNFGISLTEYIKYKKIAAAIKLLESGVKKSEVAASLNFKDYSTFYRQYKSLIE